MDSVVAEQQQKITMLETKLSQYRSELGSLKKQATGKDIHSVAANAAAAVILKKSRMAQEQQQQLAQSKVVTSSSNLQKMISNASNHSAAMKAKVKSPIRKASRAERKAAMRPEGTTRYWSQAEHERFLSACRMFGARKYIQIAEYVGTRSAKQVRTHSQKYEIRLVREKTTTTVESNAPHQLESATEMTDALAISMKKQNKSHKKRQEAEQEQMDNLPTSPLKSPFYGKNANEIFMSPILSTSTSIGSVSDITAARATLSESLSLSSMASDDDDAIADEDDEDDEEEEDLDDLEEHDSGAMFSDPALLGTSAGLAATNTKASWHNSLLLEDNFSLLPVSEHHLESHDAFRIDVSAPLDAFMNMDEVWTNDHVHGHGHDHVDMHDTAYHAGVDDWLISEDQF
mmetsp:Transcript_7325/g.13072  ORF Transcript_7325/g.13072 Transcript_7325/m.13072 type:complete len:402 (+) Transcript_7325:305-1510(+)